jgi:hypothetical protein
MRPSFISSTRAASRTISRLCVTKMSVRFCSRRRAQDQVEDHGCAFAIEIAGRLVGKQD